jgi:hypothetical protein
MTKSLERTVKEAIGILKKQQEKRTRESIKERKFWKGKKIISVIRWEKMGRSRSETAQKEMMECYIPDGYLHSPFLVSYKTPQALVDKMNQWYQEVYRGFLEDRKFPEYGKYRCRRCILNTSYRPLEQDFGLKEVLLKGTDDDGNTLDFPYSCPVVNIFQCPYEQGKDDNYFLFALKLVRDIMDKAIAFAVERVGPTNEPYDFDFKKGLAYSGFYLDSGDEHRGEKPINNLENLKGREPSKIPLQNIKDIFNALTTRKSLDKILEQYLEHLDSQIADPKFESREDKSDLKSDAEYLKKVKNEILDYVSNIKKIKIEDIRDFGGRNLEEERAFLKQEAQELAQRESNPKSRKEAIGKCVSCGKLCNIRCLNCNNTWLCLDHWREHGIKTHDFKSKIP